MERRLSSVQAALLCGGRSRRMGHDKALLTIAGQPLVQRVADRCRRAGCDPILAIGGNGSRFSELGLTAVADDEPGEGPLAGILTALAVTPPASTVFVVAVDLPGIDADGITRVITALEADPDADVAVPVSSDGRRHHLHAAWRPRCRPVLARAFAGGERAVRRVLDELTVAQVGDVDDRSLVDVDTPQDLRRWHSDDAIDPGDR